MQLIKYDFNLALYKTCLYGCILLTQISDKFFHLGTLIPAPLIRLAKYGALINCDLYCIVIAIKCHFIIKKFKQIQINKLL